MSATDLSRRGALGLLGSALLLPRPLLAAEGTARRFLFVFCDGGWDSSAVFAPLFDNAYVDHEPAAARGSAGGIDFVDHPARPMVRTFFERYGSRACVVNGIDFETVAHDRGRRLLMTGASQGPEDWGALLASASPEALTAPHLVISGPTYTTLRAGAVVRVGEEAELAHLLAGTMGGDLALDTAAEALVQQHLARRGEAALAAAADHAHARRFMADYGDALRQLEALSARQGDLSLAGAPEGLYGYGCEETFMSQASLAVQCFSQGLSRCAVVQDQGFCGMRWDSHNRIEDQSDHFALLFTGLLELMAALDETPGPAGGALAEEVTVVVCSELGRHPRLNAQGGKHHWPVTSMMILGGVTGGRVVGGFDEEVLAVPVDLASGEAHSSGARLTPAHLGATLLQLGGLDPAEHVAAPPLTGIIA